MPTREVRNVVLKDLFMGLLEGFGWGALAGAATIVTVRAAVGGSKDVTSWDYFIIAAAIGGGGLLGGFPGLIIGHTNEYQFAPTRD